MSGDLRGIAPQREIFIAFPPDLNDMLHVERTHDRLLDYATGAPPAQHRDRFRQTYIIFRARDEYGKFLHFENLVRRSDYASCDRRRRGKPPRPIPTNWKKQAARQAFEMSMHSEG